MVHTTDKGFVVATLNIRKDFIPCTWILGIVHYEDMQNHLVDYPYFSIDLRWKIVALASLVSIIFHSLGQKVLRNLLSLIEKCFVATKMNLNALKEMLSYGFFL
jgi:hypothetical protein